MAEREIAGVLAIPKLRILWAIAGFAAFLTSCDLGNVDPDTEMYVRVPASDMGGFLSALAAILRQDGLSASTGDSPVTGTTLHVLDAKNLSLRVWAQNAVLSSEENAACGYSAVTSVERTQYLVSVQRRSPLGQQKARELFTALRREFVRRGYVVASGQMPCEPLLR